MPDPRRFDERLKIVSPCSEDWSAMRGTDRVRLCSHCDLSVHDASRMTRADLEALARASNGRLCLRITRDPRGRIRTLDAPPALVPLARRASRLAAGAMTVALAAAAPAFGAATPLAPVAASAAATPRPSGGNGTLAGSVFDVQGAPISGTSVEVRDADGAVVASTRTGDDGAYRFEVPPGTYRLELEASGFMPHVVEDLAVGAGETDSVDVTLQVGAALTGLVMMSSPAAYDSVWHSDERRRPEDRADGEEADGETADEAGARPPLADADDPEAAIRESRNVDERDVYGDTALMYYAQNASYAKLLLDRGADPNATDMFGATPLMRAALHDDVESVGLLLKAGANVNATDDARLTALMVAADCGNEDVVKALLAAGADVRAVDARGETALSYARKEKEKAVVKILRKAGAVR